MSISIRRVFAGVLLVLFAFAGGYERIAPPARAPASPLPAQAVQELVDDLRRDDFAGYARHAVPPELHARLEAAWREGRTLWPLTELPLDTRFQGFLTALAEPRSEQ